MLSPQPRDKWIWGWTLPPFRHLTSPRCSIIQQYLLSKKQPLLGVCKRQLDPVLRANISRQCLSGRESWLYIYLQGRTELGHTSNHLLSWHRVIQIYLAKLRVPGCQLYPLSALCCTWWLKVAADVIKLQRELNQAQRCPKMSHRNAI